MPIKARKDPFLTHFKAIYNKKIRTEKIPARISVFVMMIPYLPSQAESIHTVFSC